MDNVWSIFSERDKRQHLHQIITISISIEIGSSAIDRTATEPISHSGSNADLFRSSYILSVKFADILITRYEVMPEIPPAKELSLAVNEDVNIDDTMFLMSVVTRCSRASLLRDATYHF